jgi:hypothetical protein
VGVSIVPPLGNRQDIFFLGKTEGGISFRISDKEASWENYKKLMRNYYRYFIYLSCQKKNIQPELMIIKDDNLPGSKNLYRKNSDRVVDHMG